MSGDICFDEIFSSIIATKWYRFNDSLLLEPPSSFLHDPDTNLKLTGIIDDILQPVSTILELEKGSPPLMHLDNLLNLLPTPDLPDQAAHDWSENATVFLIMELAQACAVDATTPYDSPSGNAPSNICQVFDISDSNI